MLTLGNSSNCHGQGLNGAQHVAARTNLFVVYGEQVVEESHLVRVVRQYETKWVTSETRREKTLREINKVVEGSEHHLLHMSFIL